MDSEPGLTTGEHRAFEVVSEIVTAKEGVVEPCLATIHELRSVIPGEGLLDDLRGLYRKKYVTAHLDINKNPMFGIKQNHKTTTK